MKKGYLRVLAAFGDEPSTDTLLVMEVQRMYPGEHTDGVIRQYIGQMLVAMPPLLERRSDGWLLQTDAGCNALRQEFPAIAFSHPRADFTTQRGELATAPNPAQGRQA